MLDDLLPAKTAVDVLESLDPEQTDLYRVDGFLRHADGQFESRLDLIVDFGHMQQFTCAERMQIARLFITNRAADEIFFELHCDPS